MADTIKEPALVFDFGGVLVEWDPRHLYRKVFNGDEGAMERFLEEVDFYEWNQKQDAGRTFAEAVAELCREYPQHCELIRLYDLRYEESIAGTIEANIALLEKLKSSGYALFGLSNWPEEKYRLVRPKFAFFDLFDEVIISGEVKVAKPDRRIFTILLQRAGRQPWQCVYIDDSKVNVEVARELGFRCIHYRSSEQLQTELAANGVVITAS